MKPINYARLALSLERGELDAKAASRALADVVMARAGGARGLADRIDDALRPLVPEEPKKD